MDRLRPWSVSASLAHPRAPFDSSLARPRARFDRLKGAPPWLLVWLAASVLLFVQRFAYWDGVAFISDEAAFLNTARDEVATNTWVSASPLYGTQGLRYGPSVLWFYAVVQRLFGDDVRTSIAAMCFLVTLAHALAVLGVARAFKLSALEVLVLTAFVASSSYQMFWSRLAWDQLVNVCGSVLLLVLASSTLSVWHAVGMGLLIGVALSSHLFSAPLVVCVFFVMLFEHWHQPRRALLLGTVITGIVLLVNYPYFLFVLNDESQLKSHPGTFSLSGILDWLIKPAEVSGFSGFSYFFDGDWDLLLAQLGAGYDWMRFSQVPGVLTLVALLGLCLGLGESHGEGASRLARLSLVSWLFYTLLYDYRGLDSHPHYTFPYWWVVLVGIASLLVQARRVSTWLSGSLLIAVFVISIAQLNFIRGWQRYVEAHGGTQGVHYATPVLLQYRALKSACSRDEAAILVRNQTVLFNHALNYVAETEPACREKQIAFCKRKCPPPIPGVADLRLVYLGSTGGEIGVRE